MLFGKELVQMMEKKLFPTLMNVTHLSLMQDLIKKKRKVELRMKQNKL